MRLKRIVVLGASMGALSLVITSCGSTGGPSSSAKATIRIASFNFSESIILAHIYGDALKNKGYTITYRDKLGNREIVEPALASGNNRSLISSTAAMCIAVGNVSLDD